MSKRKRRTAAAAAAAAWRAECQARLDGLAQYNAECARGIVHTAEWDERMAKRQAAYDADVAQQAQWEAEAYVRAGRKEVNLK